LIVLRQPSLTEERWSLNILYEASVIGKKKLRAALGALILIHNKLLLMMPERKPTAVQPNPVTGGPV